MMRLEAELRSIKAEYQVLVARYHGRASTHNLLVPSEYACVMPQTRVAGNKDRYMKFLSGSTSTQ